MKVFTNRRVILVCADVPLCYLPASGFAGNGAVGVRKNLLGVRNWNTTADLHYIGPVWGAREHSSDATFEFLTPVSGSV